jgi:hypothetical protein
VHFSVVKVSSPQRCSGSSPASCPSRGDANLDGVLERRTSVGSGGRVGCCASSRSSGPELRYRCAAAVAQHSRCVPGYGTSRRSRLWPRVGECGLCPRFSFSLSAVRHAFPATALRRCPARVGIVGNASRVLGDSPGWIVAFERTYDCRSLMPGQQWVWWLRSAGKPGRHGTIWRPTRGIPCVYPATTRAQSSAALNLGLHGRT